MSSWTWYLECNAANNFYETQFIFWLILWGQHFNPYNANLTPYEVGLWFTEATISSGKACLPACMVALLGWLLIFLCQNHILWRETKHERLTRSHGTLWGCSFTLISSILWSLKLLLASYPLRGNMLASLEAKLFRNSAHSLFQSQEWSVELLA